MEKVATKLTVKTIFH